MNSTPFQHIVPRPINRSRQKDLIQRGFNKNVVNEAKFDALSTAYNNSILLIGDLKIEATVFSSFLLLSRSIWVHHSTQNYRITEKNSAKIACVK